MMRDHRQPPALAGKPPTPIPSPQRGRGGAPVLRAFPDVGPGRLSPPPMGEGGGDAPVSHGRAA